jgi:hypothetical protein
MMVVVGDAAAVEGRRRPEPGRLYAAMQANSLVLDANTGRWVQCM